MSDLPAWASDPESLTLSESAYDALPDQLRKLIEVIELEQPFAVTVPFADLDG